MLLALLGLFASLGLSIVGTNLLCHRYLVEKARVVIKLYVSALTDCSPIFHLHPPFEPHVFFYALTPFAVFGNTEHCSLDVANGPLTRYLETLEGSFVWEARSLYIVAVGAPTFVIYQPAGKIVGIIGALAIFALVRSRTCVHFTRH
jgi:hypothetical protein